MWVLLLQVEKSPLFSSLDKFLGEISKSNSELKKLSEEDLKKQQMDIIIDNESEDDFTSDSDESSEDSDMDDTSSTEGRDRNIGESQQKLIQPIAEKSDRNVCASAAKPIQTSPNRISDTSEKKLAEKSELIVDATKGKLIQFNIVAGDEMVDTPAFKLLEQIDEALPNDTLPQHP